jgi:leader peptidase (prepilin peptidase)/N-methyltransferase
MTVAFVAATALVGLVAGGYATMLVYRSPVDLPLLGAPECPECRARLAVRDVIPVVSWFRLDRRCRHCGQTIPLRYPVVEVATAALMAALASAFGATWEVVPLLVSVPILVAVSVIDIDTYRIPNRLVFPSLAVAAVVIAVCGQLMGETDRLVGAAAGALLFSGMLFIPHLIMPAGMGFGDVKFALFLGLNLGWLHAALPLPALVISTLLAAVIGLTLQVTGRVTGPPEPEGQDDADPGEDAETGDEGGAPRARPKRRLGRTKIPFGPFLAGGTYLAYLVNEAAIDLWLGT